MNRGLRNILLLGIAFLLFLGASQTVSNIQKTITDSIKKDDPSFQGDAFYSQSLFYSTLAIFNWTAPSVINVLGPKLSMTVGSSIYIIFVLQFLFPKTWGTYLSSALLGFGSAILWTAQGTYLALNSNHKTITRNAGIFYTVSNAGGLVGNIFVMLTFNSKEEIDKNTRMYVIAIFTAVLGIALLIFLLLPRQVKSENEEFIKHGPVQAFLGAFKLFVTRNMLLLSVVCLFEGLELGFFTVVYSSCIGFTKKFNNRKELVGLSGVFVGIGGISAGVLFITFGHRIVMWSRSYMVAIGLFVYVLVFCLIFLNLPNDSIYSDTDSDAVIDSNIYVAIFCSFLLGVGDCLYNNIIVSLFGTMYADDSAPAFAILQCFLSIGSIITFITGQLLGLHYQLAVLMTVAVIASICFVKVELEHKRRNLTFVQ